MKIKQLSVFLSVVILCVSMTGCEDRPDTDSILDAGASLFAEGEEEESYAFLNTVEVLDDLLDNYAGSLLIPTGTPMDEDTFKDLVGDQDKPDEEPGDKSDEGPDDKPDEEPGDKPDQEPDDKPDDKPDISKSDTVVQCADDMMEIFHKAYDETSEIISFPVNGYSINGEDLQYVYTQLQREDPYDVCCVEEWSYYTQGDMAYVNISYNMDISELKNLKVETRNLVKQAVASMDTQGKTPYELVYTVNEYLCDISEYPASEPYAPVTHTTYGALKNGSSVCEGYACAAKMLLNELNVVCDIEVGMCTNGEGHAWNLVQLDGEWYQMDVTWNDGSGDRQLYFLVTDEYMRQSRSWKENLYPVSANQPYKL